MYVTSPHDRDRASSSVFSTLTVSFIRNRRAQWAQLVVGSLYIAALGGHTPRGHIRSKTLCAKFRKFDSEQAVRETGSEYHNR